MVNITYDGTDAVFGRLASRVAKDMYSLGFRSRVIDLFTTLTPICTVRPYVTFSCWEVVNSYYPPKTLESLNELVYEKCCGCHPARYTFRLLWSVSEYTFVMAYHRLSSRPGTDCSINGVALHDGHGNGYEHASNEYDDYIIVWRESGWGRTEVCKASVTLDYDTWYILVGKRKSDGTLITTIYDKNFNKLATCSGTDTTYNKFSFVSTAGGRPYFVAALVVFEGYTDLV